MGGKRKPSRHQVSEIKRATSAIEATTGRSVIGARFFPDGSFSLTVEPAKSPESAKDTPQPSPEDVAKNEWDTVLTDAAP
jgi:hypothetical protein